MVAQIRTFKSHRGRLRTVRRDALDRLLPVYGVPVDDPLDLPSRFGRRAPLVLEVGSGMGEGTAELAAADPDRDYLAAEVHPPGVANLLRLIEARGLTNLRVANVDALELVRRIPPETLAAIHAFFPDPWPKRRHHKRRLFQPAHVALLRSRLAPGGIIHAATDWEEYAKAMRATLTADPELVNAYEGWAPRQPHRPRTKYEQRADAAGRPTFELIFRRR
jgi:tRNA (guanine-N7-)-methyltransferase